MLQRYSASLNNAECLFMPRHVESLLQLLIFGKSVKERFYFTGPIQEGLNIVNEMFVSYEKGIVVRVVLHIFLTH